MTLVYTGDYVDLLHKDFLRLIRIITFPTSTIFAANKERKKKKVMYYSEFAIFFITVKEAQGTLE